jgi:hypothetical protein
MCGGAMQPVLFVVPAGTLVPLLAIAVSLLMLAGATRQQLLLGAAALMLVRCCAEDLRRLRVLAAEERSATFLLACLAALELKGVILEEI